MSNPAPWRCSRNIRRHMRPLTVGNPNGPISRMRDCSTEQTLLGIAGYARLPQSEWLGPLTDMRHGAGLDRLGHPAALSRLSSQPGHRLAAVLVPETPSTSSALEWSSRWPGGNYRRRVLTPHGPVPSAINLRAGTSCRTLLARFEVIAPTASATPAQAGKAAASPKALIKPGCGSGPLAPAITSGKSRVHKARPARAPPPLH